MSSSVAGHDLSLESTLDVLQRATNDLADANQAQERNSTIRTLSVLMPVYNERWTIEDIVERVLNSPVGLDVEVVAVDDGSTDGSWEVLESIAGKEPRFRAFRHERNRGKGAAIRTALDQAIGDVIVIQDADLEYDPAEYVRLLAPILDGRADAVFGSRFAGTPRRVLLFWHSLANGLLTLMSNMLNDLNLTDMETCYKMVRADVFKQLCLRSNTFTFEPELTCRLAQWSARIYEVPISYSGRTIQEGKKIRAIDGLKAIMELLRCRFFDTRFCHHTGMYVLKSVSRARAYNRWLLDQCRPFLGDGVLEAGAGIGNLSSMFLDRQRLVLVDHDPIYVSHLRDRFGQRRNVRALQADLTDPSVRDHWNDESLNTIVCSNVLEHLKPDGQVLQSFHDSLVPGGHCIIIVPASPRLYTGLDKALGHFRRYSAETLLEKMKQAGFDVVFTKQFCKAGSIGWWINGRILRRRHLSPRQMIWFDRIWPFAKALDKFLPVPGMSLMMVGRRPSAP